MKKILPFILSLILTFSFSFVLISCKNPNNNPENNTPSPITKPFSIDLSGFVANIGNATALGISPKTNQNTQVLSNNTPDTNKETEYKNYIVMSTIDYDANSPETDKNGLKKVTFTKTTTKNITTETTGTKYIIAIDKTISIAAIEGFKYSVYHNDTLIYSEVEDNADNDKDKNNGFITLTNLIDGLEYKVIYKGIGKEETITQDEIDGEIDKLYVLNNYTFISFVPEGQSYRPTNNSNNVNTTANYDKANYLSNNSRQSFVIHNSTGYVYKLDNVAIEEIKNNLITIAEKVYDIRITDNNELQFYTVVQNETLSISHFFKDTYGNKFIENNYLNVLDEENKTLYYTNKNKYLFSNEGVVFVQTKEYFHKITENFTETEINLDESYTFERGIIDEGYYYNSGSRRNLKNYTTENSYADHYLPGFLINYKTMVIYATAKSCDTVYNLYLANLYGENGLPHRDYFHYNPDLDLGTIAEKILDDIQIEKMGDFLSYKDWKFRKTTLTETIFYQVIIGEDDRAIIVNDNYIAPPQETITLQPLNKKY